MNCFVREPAADPAEHRVAYADPERGPHCFFRHSHAAMQRRFVELARVDRMPRAFLHGNPHVANYAKNMRGAAMVDFDRARFGPFGYDVSRFLVSVSLLRRDENDGRLLHPAVIDSFYRGYTAGCSAPERPFAQMRDLREKPTKAWQRDLVRYLEKRRAWGGRLAKHPIDAGSERLRRLLESYLASRGEQHLADRFRIVAAAEVPGSLGKVHTLLYVMSDSESLEDRFIDVKEVYDEPDDEHFFHTYAHNGERMVAAGELHAPGWEFIPGWATVDGVEYWVRGIPRQNEKLKGRLSTIQQVDLTYSVGSQLGRAHGLSVRGTDAPGLLACFEERFDELVEVAVELRHEMRAAHGEYVSQARRWRH